MDHNINKKQRIFRRQIVEKSYQRKRRAAFELLKCHLEKKRKKANCEVGEIVSFPEFYSEVGMGQLDSTFNFLRFLQQYAPCSGDENLLPLLLSWQVIPCFFPLPQLHDRYTTKHWSMIAQLSNKMLQRVPNLLQKLDNGTTIWIPLRFYMRPNFEISSCRSSQAIFRSSVRTNSSSIVGGWVIISNGKNPRSAFSLIKDETWTFLFIKKLSTSKVSLLLTSNKSSPIYFSGKKDKL